MSFNHRNIFIASILWAFSIAFAQVYVGVHFPIDVISGAGIGTLIGLLMGYIFKHFFQLNYGNLEGNSTI